MQNTTTKTSDLHKCQSVSEVEGKYTKTQASRASGLVCRKLKIIAKDPVTKPHILTIKEDIKTI